jgi:hypothetical protein
MWKRSTEPSKRKEKIHLVRYKYNLRPLAGAEEKSDILFGRKEVSSSSRA